MGSRSNYAVSDFLADRHPANQEPFSGAINPKENTVAYGNRAIPKLIDLLATELTEKERLEALKNVLSLDLAHQETKLNAVNQGLIESMKHCLENESAGVRAHAAEVLGKLANLKQAQDRMVESQTLLPLLNALKDTTNVCIPACNAVLKFASIRNGCLILIKFQAISYLVPLLAKQNQPGTIVVPCLEALSLMTSAADEAILAALECDAIPPLQNLLSRHADMVLKILCNLAKHMKGKEAIVNAHMIPVFSQHLHDPRPEVQLLSLSALMLVCVLASAKREATEIPELLDHLLYVLVAYDEVKDQNSLNYKYAKMALTLISEYPAGRKQIEACVSKYGGDNEALLRKRLYSKP